MLQQPTPENFEIVACPQCTCDERSPVLSSEPNDAPIGHRFLVVRCSRCGLVYSSPRLRANALAAAYEACEFDPASPPTESNGRAAGPLRRWWRHLTQRQVVTDWVEEGPVLDVGCGFGDALLALKRRGFEVSGIESSPAAARVCRDRGLEVFEGSVEDALLPEASFRTILMSHVLEHIPQPIPLLRRLRDALVPGGRLVIAVPNHRGAVARIFGAAWHGWDPPFHLTHFDPRTLTRMVDSAGFRTIHRTTRGNPEDITRSLGKLLGQPVNALWLRVALLPSSLFFGSMDLGGEVCLVAQRDLDV